MVSHPLSAWDVARGNGKNQRWSFACINRDGASRVREEPSGEFLGAVHNEIRYCKWTWLISDETAGWTSAVFAIRPTTAGFRALFCASAVGRICIFPKFSLHSLGATSAAFDTPLDEAITTLFLFILQTLRSLG